MQKKYSIGLDIGTNSVGWAVVDENNKLIRKRMPVNVDGIIKKTKKNFWGVRLFDEGQTAEGTRLSRTARRRLRRRKNRICYLQEIFSEAINAVDKGFLMRLEESFLVPEDKELSRHPIFGSIDEEKNYHEKYPTIYHLRKAIADSKERYDIRLVYLAMAHIIKYRGHFLIEGKLNSENSSVDATFKQFLDAYNTIFSKQTDESYINFLKYDGKVEEILKDKYSPSKKVEQILKLYPSEKRNSVFGKFLTLIVGNQADFKAVFELDEDMKIQIPKEEFEDELEKLLGIIGDEYTEVFQGATDTYNAMKLANILSGTDTQTGAKLSDSMIRRYDQHKEDLSLLKGFIKRELPDSYYEFFKDEKKDGYAGYIDGKTTETDFYKYTKKVLGKTEGAEYFLSKIEREDFLRKQRTFDNGVIPHQIHMDELLAIIESQSQYYPFLSEEKDKILSIFSFRIPYYVGPLTSDTNASRFAWMTKNGEGKIRPWNFDELVDREISATSFIERMTNWDTYLPDQKVLPQHSMVYELYTVLNELTKVSYTNDQGNVFKFSSDEKEKIIRGLFKQNRKVSERKLIDFLHNEFNIESPTVNGIEEAFLAKLGTYHDLLKVGVSKDFMDNEENEELLEEIVKILTIFEDRKMLRSQLGRYEEILSEDVLKKLERRHYTGWGRLSRKLLTEIRDERTQKSIMDYLWDDDDTPHNRNRNFMQLINDNDLSFKRVIEASQAKNDSDRLEDVVHDLTGSPAIKKGILQSLKIVDELVAIMGYPPESVVVEMARENQTTVGGRNRSKPRLKVLEEKLKELGSVILVEQPTDNDKLKRDALFLYYLQNGKDMYTEDPLDISNLSNYDIDHIIPQAFIDDDSIDNRVLVSSAANRRKTDDVPSVEVANKMEPFWRQLHKAGLISDRKLSNLTKGQRGGLTEEDKAGFINRQLVETRQITKHVARILHERLNGTGKVNDKKVDVITLKSSIVSQFRKQFEIYKVREVNDYHHAHDAYLNAVVSRIILNVYPKLKPEFVYGDYAKVNLMKISRATAKKQFYSNILGFFKKEQRIVDEETGELVWSNKWIGEIKQVLDSRQMNVVKKVEIQKGKFSNDTVLPKSNSPVLIKRKNEWATDKYGGVGSPNNGLSVLITHEKGKKAVLTKEIAGVSIMEMTAYTSDPVGLFEKKGYTNPSVIMELPKYTVFEFPDGRRRLLASFKESQKGNQMVLPGKLIKLLYHAKRFDKNDDSKAYVEKHREEFQAILDVILPFAREYTLAEKKADQIQQLFDEKATTSDLQLLSSSFINLLKFNEVKSYAPFVFLGTKISETRYRSTNELLKSQVVFQSITGLYESRIDLGK